MTVDPLRVPQEFLMELAMGCGEPLKLANKYGYSDLEFLQLNSHPWFNKAIEQARANLEAQGFTFQNKMAMMAEDLLVETYQAAKKTESVSLKLDVAKHLAKLAKLEPSPSLAGGAVSGSGFTLIISVPETEKPLIINQTSSRAEDVTPESIVNHAREASSLVPTNPELAALNAALEYTPDPSEEDDSS